MNNKKLIDYCKTKIMINKFTKNRKYYIHNDKGLGDNVFNMIFFILIKDFIITNNIKIFYFTKQQYISQLQEFLFNNENIILFPFNKKPHNSLEMWINTKFYGYNHDLVTSVMKNVNYNKFYINFFNVVLNKLNFNISIDKFVYYDKNLLNRYHLISDKYKNFDILILNSKPLSGQYNYNKNEWDDYIVKLNNSFNILTTTKVNGILCTGDDNLSIKDIASLSTKAKIVIAINSGVFPGLLNYYTLTNVKHFFIFDNRCFYSYPNFENKKLITDITFQELQRYLN